MWTQLREQRMTRKSYQINTKFWQKYALKNSKGLLKISRTFKPLCYLQNCNIKLGTFYVKQLK